MCFTFTEDNKSIILLPPVWDKEGTDHGNFKSSPCTVPLELYDEKKLFWAIHTQCSTLSSGCVLYRGWWTAFFLHVWSICSVIACVFFVDFVSFFLAGSSAPVATGATVAAVAGMSWPLQGHFFYDLALIIRAKGVVVPSKLTTPTWQKSDSWLQVQPLHDKTLPLRLMLRSIFYTAVPLMFE